MSATSRPPPITLGDLARPRFTGEVRAILDMMSEAGKQVSLHPEALMQAAMEETELHDFGPDDFLTRLDILCRSLRDEAGLNDAGLLAQSLFLTGLLRNRLLLEDLVSRHPEIVREKIERPIFICGLPRTGTTHLHNLMSADPALRSLPYWESLEPVLGERDRRPEGEPDPRLERTEVALSFVNAAMPEFKRMHEMTVDHVHEEIQLLAIDFSTMLFETIAPIPSWRDHYLGRDQRSSYAYLKKILQALQWLRGGSRWILKSPQHLEQFPALFETFPDATFVVTHRDPVSVTASMVTMLGYSARLGHDRVDIHRIGDYWVDRLGRMLHACVESRDVLPGDRTIDVHFDEFMEDDVAMVRRIYDLADQPFVGETETAMTNFMKDNPRGRHGGVIYDLDAFGIDRNELRNSLSFYGDRFGVREESSPR
jgi:PAS domain-containing protein